MLNVISIFLLWVYSITIHGIIFKAKVGLFMICRKGLTTCISILIIKKKSHRLDIYIPLRALFLIKLSHIYLLYVNKGQLLLLFILTCLN